MNRRLQFGLRALLLAVVVAAAFFGGAQWQYRRDEYDMRLKSRMLPIVRSSDALKNKMRSLTTRFQFSLKWLMAGMAAVGPAAFPQCTYFAPSGQIISFFAWL